MPAMVSQLKKTLAMDNSEQCYLMSGVKAPKRNQNGLYGKVEMEEAVGLPLGCLVISIKMDLLTL